MPYLPSHACPIPPPMYHMGRVTITVKSCHGYGYSVCTVTVTVTARGAQLRPAVVGAKACISGISATLAITCFTPSPRRVWWAAEHTKGHTISPSLVDHCGFCIFLSRL